MLLLPRTIFHPVMLAGVKLLRYIRHQKIVYLNAKPRTAANAIYAVNHSCIFDVPISCEAIKDHAILLAGVQPMPIADRVFLNANGTIWVDRHNKASKARSKVRMLDVLKRGKSLLIFPEGTWNLSQNALHLPLYWGIIDIARQSSKPIIPVCLEYIGQQILVKFDKPITVDSNDGKQEKIDELSASFATMKYEIFEQYCKCPWKKENKTDWETRVADTLGAYPHCDFAYEKSVIRKTHISPEEAFAHLDQLIVCPENAFLLRDRKAAI